MAEAVALPKSAKAGGLEREGRHIIVLRLLTGLTCLGYLAMAVGAMMFFQQGDVLQNSFIANQVALGHIQVYDYFAHTHRLRGTKTTMPPLSYLLDGAYLKLLLLLRLDPIAPTPGRMFHYLFGHSGGPRFWLGMILIKLPFALTLVGAVPLVLMLVKDRLSSRVGLILWLTSPAVIVSVLMQTQNDIFPAVSTLGALVAFQRRRLIWGMLLLGLAAAFKNYALLLVPLTALLLSHRRPLDVMKLGLAGILPPVLIVLPFWNSIFVQRVLQAHDGSSILAANGYERYPLHLFLVAYAALLLLAWIAARKPRQTEDIAALWVLTLLTVFLFSFWFSQWLVWLVPMVLLLAAGDMLLLGLWSSINVWLLVDNIVNSGSQLDGGMLLPIFGQSFGRHIWGKLYIYGWHLGMATHDAVFMFEMALFAALAVRAIQWLVARRSAVPQLIPLTKHPHWAALISVLGLVWMGPYVAVMFIQHYVH